MYFIMNTSNMIDMRKFEIIKSYYNNNMKSASSDYEVLGWESEEAQKARFDMLLSNVDIEGKKLLDIGCGLGNLLEYINKSDIKVDYTGVDVLPEMIERARAKGLDGQFFCMDIFKNNPFKDNSYDIIYASGIFNLNLGNNKDFLIKALELFFRLAKESICFNLLHYKSPAKDDTYHYFIPDEVLDIIDTALQNEKSKVKIIEDYLQNDFTVICERTTII